MSPSLVWPRTESLAMPEAVPASGRVRNFKVCGNVNMVSGHLYVISLLTKLILNGFLQN